MPKTPLNQPIHIGQATFFSHPCPHEDSCQKYNPALKLTVTIKGIDGQPKQIDKLNKCTVGGGVGCGSYKHRVNKMMGWYEPFQNRSAPVEAPLKYRIGEKQQ